MKNYLILDPKKSENGVVVGLATFAIHSSALFHMPNLDGRNEHSFIDCYQRSYSIKTPRTSGGYTTSRGNIQVGQYRSVDDALVVIDSLSMPCPSFGNVLIAMIKTLPLVTPKDLRQAGFEDIIKASKQVDNEDAFTWMVGNFFSNLGRKTTTAERMSLWHTALLERLHTRWGVTYGQEYVDRLTKTAVE